MSRNATKHAAMHVLTKFTHMKSKVFDTPYKELIPFNSNNSWGFGGAYGDKYVFNDNLYLKIATACYRHLPSNKFIAIYHNDERVFDMSYSAAALKKANNKINELI